MSCLVGTAGRMRLAAAAVATASLALVGCSSSSASSTSQGTSMSSPVTSSHVANAPATSGAGSTSGAGTDSASAGNASASIAIKNFAYHVSGTVAAGAIVHVTNDDSTEHTVTADAGHGFDVAVQPGKTATFTAPQAAGRYRFHCDFHADMHGTLTVT